MKKPFRTTHRLCSVRMFQTSKIVGYEYSFGDGTEYIIRQKRAIEGCYHLSNEKKQTPAWSLLKRRELTQRINALAEELEDLRTEKNRILASFDLTDDKDMNEIRRWTKQQEAAIQILNDQQNRCEQELNHALEEYEALSTHAANLDPNALWPERLKERENLTNEARATLQTRFGADFSSRYFHSAESDVRLYLEDDERRLERYAKQRKLAEREIKPIIFEKQGKER